jgi:acetyl esterase/lipase
MAVTPTSRPSCRSRSFTIVAKADGGAGTPVAHASRMAWRSCCFAALAACASDVEVVRDVAYDDRHGAATEMDVYLPAGWDDGALRPAVMFVHGGGWRMGSAEAHEGHALRLAESGYVAVSIDYRLVPDGSYPRAMQDTQCALSALRARAADLAIDPDRIAVAGYSAGGHLVSLLGVGFDEPDLVPDCAAGPTAPPAAVISGAGPQDLHGRWGEHDAIVDMIGGSEEEYPERYRAASPITHARPDAPPFLFIHGGDDWFVPIEQSRAMRDALRAEGVDARLLELAGTGHLTALGAGSGTTELGIISIDVPEAWIAIDDFLADTVGAP